MSNLVENLPELTLEQLQELLTDTGDINYNDIKVIYNTYYGIRISELVSVIRTVNSGE